jgi:hypothetical protein
MYEYRSLRASTYDVDSLIDRLNGADGDGWEVVTVVPAGGDMVAIVRRPRGTADAAAVASHDEPAVVAAVAEAPVVVAEPEPEPVHTAPAVEEPAGWGAAPEPEVVAPVAASTYQPAAEVVEPMPMAEAEPAADSTQVIQQVTTTPAGWYPDPSGRFELRYWNGTAWTEHVARGGQQYTDPPVA